MTHYLKTWEQYFSSIKRGEKKFEVRENDRDFKVEDTLILQEYNPHSGSYTGEEVTAKVTYILYGGRFSLPTNICIMSIELLQQ